MTVLLALQQEPDISHGVILALSNDKKMKKSRCVGGQENEEKSMCGWLGGGLLPPPSPPPRQRERDAKSPFVSAR